MAESEDVPGLVAEAESLNALAKKLRVLIPELLELNGVLEPGSGPVEFVVRYETNCYFRMGKDETVVGAG